MRQPLEEVLEDSPEWARADSLSEAEDRLRAVFVEAQEGANAYTAERLQEVYEVAERALALSTAFPAPAKRSGARATAAAWWRRLPSLVSRFGGGLVLAACAPLVANTSPALAVAAGVTAVLTLVAARAGDPKKASPPAPSPRAVEAKMRGLLSAADRSLWSMTAPRALEAPASPRSAFHEDDILQLMQDMLAFAHAEPGNDEAAMVADNAERLLRRTGYKVVWDGPAALFETMHDPSAHDNFLLKPALEHHDDPAKTIFGVKVRGRTT